MLVKILKGTAEMTYLKAELDEHHKQYAVGEHEDSEGEGEEESCPRPLTQCGIEQDAFATNRRGLVPKAL